MATAAQRRAYARKLNNISKQHQRMERDMLTTSVQLLRNVRDRIAGQLTGTEFNEFRIAEQTAQLNTIIDEYDAQLRSLANGAVRQSFDLGERAVIEPLQEIDLTGVFFRPSEAQVDILAQFSADLVGGVTEDLRRKVNRTIRMSALGGQSSLDAMRQITADLGIPTKRTARAKGVSYEAERILRTETNRAYNLANYSQQEKVSQDIPGLQKRWMATGDGRTRMSHLNAHGQTVGIKDKFKVGGAELNFPGDPAGPPSETINCRCRSITIPPDFDEVEMPVDKKVQAEKEKRAELPTAEVPARRDLERGRFRRFQADPFGGEDDIEDWSQNASYRAWYAGLSDAEREWIELYKQEGYEWINAALRGDYDDLDELLSDYGMTEADFGMARRILDSAIRRHRIPNEITVWRGGAHPTLTRALESGRNLDDLVGMVISDEAYVSTSLNSGSADDFVRWAGPNGFKFEIQVPRGSHGAYVEYADPLLQEYEFLLARGTRLEILEATEIEGVRQITARVIQ